MKITLEKKIGISSLIHRYSDTFTWDPTTTKQCFTNRKGAWRILSNHPNKILTTTFWLCFCSSCCISNVQFLSSYFYFPCQMLFFSVQLHMDLTKMQCFNNYSPYAIIDISNSPASSKKKKRLNIFMEVLSCHTESLSSLQHP